MHLCIELVICLRLTIFFLLFCFCCKLWHFMPMLNQKAITLLSKWFQVGSNFFTMAQEIIERRNLNIK